MKAKPERKRKTAPSAHQSRMIELEGISAITKLTLAEIGERVAKEFGRTTAFTREYVRLVFKRWGVKTDYSRVGRNGLNSAIKYISGSSEGTHRARKVALKLGVPARSHLKKIQRDNRIPRISQMWKSGISIEQIAISEGVTNATAQVMIVRYRKLRPDLFPYRRSGWV